LQARAFPVAAQWASILTDEFSNQGNMEIELGIPTQLFGGPPVRDNVVKMGESQIGFINVFARPLFENIAKLLPGMVFMVDTSIENERVWQLKIKEEKEIQERGIVRNETFESGLLSPRSGSPVRTCGDGHQSSPAALHTQPEGSDRPFSEGNGHPVLPIDAHATGTQRGRGSKKWSKEKLYLGSSSTTDIASASTNGQAKKGGTWKKILRKFR
jgi:3',5'-cyclic-nucleotide phosphodiesterase